MTEGTEGKIARLNADDWRVIHRVFDEHVELTREFSDDADTKDMRYLELIRDQIVAELALAVKIERQARDDA